MSAAAIASAARATRDPPQPHRTLRLLIAARPVGAHHGTPSQNLHSPAFHNELADTAQVINHEIAM